MKRSKIETVLRDWSGKFGLVVIVYLLATILTDAYFMGDTLYYVDAVLLHIHGGNYQIPESGPNYLFWEFGHLLWRPLGWLVWPLFRPFTKLFVGDDERSGLILTLMALNWIAGLVSTLTLKALLERFVEQRWVINVVTIAFIFTHGFLNYTQTGCSYVPGLSLLLIGFYLLIRNGERSEPLLRTSALAGVCLAGAVTLWVPYVLAIPGALSVPLFLSEKRKNHFKLILQVCLAGALFGAIAYALALGNLGIHDVSGFKAWMSGASHGLSQGQGIPAVAFGLARSFINTGQDSIIFKRYLVHDPLNPVTLFDLLKLSLWKIALFYLFLFSILINLLRSTQGKRVLGLLLFNAIPVIAFALYWQGTVMERYMPLYPVLFLALGISLSSVRARPLFKYLTLAFIAVMIVTNVNALSKLRLNRQQERTVARFQELQPLLKPHSRVFVVKDELSSFTGDFPLHPLNRESKLQFLLHSFVSLDKPETLRWRKDFSSDALRVWQSGGDAWVSKRLLTPRPRPEWGWVEGADRRVSWLEIYDFFQQLEVGQSVGGDDGFVLLLPTSNNKHILESVTRGSQP